MGAEPRRMKSSDQRYFHVRRPKREAYQYPELADAISMARADPKIAPVVHHIARESSVEFTHIMLACGRTATDFRRNFRRGCARHNIIPASDIAPYDALLAETLDGYVCLRLTREQYWNLKTRSGKVRPQDTVVHDPQGKWWSLLLHYMLAGQSADHVGLLKDFRGWAVRLFDPESAGDLQKHVDKAVEKHGRFLAGAEIAFPERVPEVSQKLAEKAYERLGDCLDFLMKAKGHEGLTAQIRPNIEKSLVVVEAFVAGGDVRKAALDPDTSQRHCSAARLKARITACHEVMGMAPVRGP